jgi:hypothetical protein
MANIGEPRRVIEIIPLPEPEPVREPDPDHVPAPEEVPQEVPA